MAFDYATIRDNVVIPQLADKGKPGWISVNTPPTGAPYDTQIGEPVLHPVTLITKQFKKADNRGTLVEMTDQLFMVSTNGVTIDPALADRLIVAGITYQIIRIDPLQTGPTVMFWDIHVRK